jgi:glycosyltransferase involved in cell wall biosynthesis
MLKTSFSQQGKPRQGRVAQVPPPAQHRSLLRHRHAWHQLCPPCVLRYHGMSLKVTVRELPGLRFYPVFPRDPRGKEFDFERLMINGKRIAVVMPAYNAEKTLEVTVGELPDLVDISILVDDHSSDRTVDLARRMGLLVFQHDRNYGYGRNQQTCYREALAAGADVVIMLHPDYQYTPHLVTAMASMVAYDVYDVVLGSRIIGGTALRGGMPLYKYISNRLLTAFENLFLRVKLSEYHTGYRAFSRKVLTELPLLENSDDFVFDNQMLAQCVHFGFRIGEVSCPTKYFEEASSINFRRSVKYGFGVLATTLQFALQRTGLIHLPRFSDKGRKLEPGYPTYYTRRTETARPA